MAINDVAGEMDKGCIMYEIFREFLDQNLVSSLCNWNPKNAKKAKKTSKKTYIFISCGKESAVLISVRIVIMELFDVYLLLFQALF